jgi:deoxyribodipyrimidine photo-lyase
LITNKVIIFWFRRDLRLNDNVGLSKALSIGLSVLPIFIFDKNILDHLENKTDRWLHYIHQALENINLQLRSYQSSILTFYSKPLFVKLKFCQFVVFKTVKFITAF